MDYVWYLSYGSNMYKDRFLCYINGGRFEASNIVEQGCKDNSPPVDEKNVVIENELFFSLQSSKWQNMGIAFVMKRKTQGLKTFAKMYLITREQFEDVVKQENGIDVNDEINIDYVFFNKKCEVHVFEKGYYGMLLKIDEVDGVPVYTFTLPVDPDSYSKPSREYLVSIIKGIKLNFGNISDELIDVFSNLGGIKGEYTLEELTTLIQSIKI